MEGFEIFIVAAVIIVLVIIFCVARYFYDKRHQEPKNIRYSKRLKYISVAFIKNEENYYALFKYVIDYCAVAQFANKRLFDMGIISEEEYRNNLAVIEQAKELAVKTHGEWTIKMLEQSNTQHTNRTLVSSVYSDIFGMELKKNMKTYYELGKEEVYLTTNTYQTTANTVVSATCSNDEPYCCLTVNLNKLNDPELAYLNVNLFGIDVEDFFVKNGLGVKVEGRERQSGHVIYPLYRLNLDKINKGGI